MTWKDAPPITRAFLVLTGSIFAVRMALARQYLLTTGIQASVPLHDHFFPWALREPSLLAAAYFAPFCTELPVLFRPSQRRMRRHSIMVTLCAGILLIHQASYFFATWVVVFWAGLFLMWMAGSALDEPQRACSNGPLLAQALISFWFLGGAVGKWTAAYWAGEPFYDLFFAHHPYVVYSLLRVWVDADALRSIATWVSRSVVVIETAMVLTVFLPARTASAITIVVALGMWLSAGDLFDVAWPIIGTALAGRILSGAAAPPAATR